MPEHGGNLAAAVRRWGIPREQWLDLSTGINPHPWPVPPLPTTILHRLPEEDDGLEEAARRYFGVEQVLPVPGSQTAIAWLPRLRSCSRVGIVVPTYTEHEYHWRQAGHDVRCLSFDEVETALGELEVLVLVRPNNPDGACPSRLRVLDWWQQLRIRGGWLVVDEAFVDAVPEDSLSEYVRESGFIVLRSFGKFFGLPGLRLGFVLAHEALLKSLRDLLGPWSVSTIARFWGAQALRDVTWQARARERLLADSDRLETLLRSFDLIPEGGTAFYRYLRHVEASDIYEALAAMGILVRRYRQEDGYGALRLGLPGGESCWQHLKDALEIIIG